MKNILLCTDGSSNARNAIKYALNFFSGESKHFILLSTYMIPDTDFGNIILVNDELKLNTQILIDRELNWCKSLPEFKGFTIVPMSSFGKTSNVVYRMIKAKNIDLIVAGTKGRNTANKSILGSTTCDLIEKIPCNKMIIPTNHSYASSIKRVIITDTQKLASANWWSTISNLTKLEKASLALFVFPHPAVLSNNSAMLQKQIKEHLINIQYFQKKPLHELSKRLNRLLQVESPDILHISVSDGVQKRDILSNITITKYPFIFHP